MSSFTQEQRQALDKKLHRRHVHSRQVEGKAIDYIEGWFAVAEANAIFGYDGWDRETTHLERLYERSRGETTSCGYLARVRIRVRAGDGLVVRDGTGWGHASAKLAGEAHERALKIAETDATKRALATFGNRFGLSLYDKDQNGVTGKKPGSTANGATHGGGLTLHTPDGKILAEHLTAEGFCTGLRQLIEGCEIPDELTQLRRANNASLVTLRTQAPNLTNGKQVHYADLLEQLIAQRVAGAAKPDSSNGSVSAERSDAPNGTPSPAPSSALPPSKITNGLRVDKSVLAIATERRLRDKAHLQFVASQSCLICDRKQAQAHHLKFAQRRGLSQKVSDEFTVPLCAAHHDELHRTGHEQDWWRKRGIDPLPIAARLWEQSRGRDQSAFRAVVAAPPEQGLGAGPELGYASPTTRA